MTSKALEAAAQALWACARPDGSPRFIAGLEADRKSILLDTTSDIILAFADNLSEEAALAHIDEVQRYLAATPGCNIRSSWVSGLRAAIAKDLE